MYGKHFASAYSGSMYGAGPVVFAVWGFAIANADRNGILEMNPRLIASTLGCDVGEVAAAIDYLCAADPHSRSKEEEGRRLVREAEYQYRMVNHSLYRAMRDEDARRDYFREKKRQSRERMRAVQSVKPVHHGQPSSTHTDTDTDTDTDIGSTNVDPLAWAEFVEHRKAIRKPLGKLSAQKNLNILAAMSADDQRRAVDATIANNWTGIFPPKGNANGTHHGHPAPRSAVDRVRAAAAARAASDPNY